MVLILQISQLQIRALELRELPSKSGAVKGKSLVPVGFLAYADTCMVLQASAGQGSCAKQAKVLRQEGTVCFASLPAGLMERRDSSL